MLPGAGREVADIFHDPQVVAAGTANLWCNHQLGTSIFVEVGGHRELGRELRRGAIDIRLHLLVLLTRDGAMCSQAPVGKSPTYFMTHRSLPRIANVRRNHQLVAPIAIEIGYDSKFRRKFAAAAIDVGAHGVVRDRRHVLPTSSSNIVLHDPHIAARTGRIRRNDEFGEPICVEVASNDELGG